MAAEVEGWEPAQRKEEVRMQKVAAVLVAAVAEGTEMAVVGPGDLAKTVAVAEMG